LFTLLLVLVFLVSQIDKPKTSTKRFPIQRFQEKLENVRHDRHDNITGLVEIEKHTKINNSEISIIHKSNNIKSLSVKNDL
jgi:hypothetical protein